MDDIWNSDGVTIDALNAGLLDDPIETRARGGRSGSGPVFLEGPAPEFVITPEAVIVPGQSNRRVEIILE